eukprot:ctg_312.g154
MPRRFLRAPHGTPVRSSSGVCARPEAVVRCASSFRHAATEWIVGVCGQRAMGDGVRCWATGTRRASRATARRVVGARSAGLRSTSCGTDADAAAPGANSEHLADGQGSAGRVHSGGGGGSGGSGQGAVREAARQGHRVALAGHHQFLQVRRCGGEDAAELDTYGQG